jgi:hypothetical protein
MMTTSPAQDLGDRRCLGVLLHQINIAQKLDVFILGMRPYYQCLTFDSVVKEMGSGVAG